MKTTSSLLAFVALCLLSGNVRAYEFSNIVTEGVGVSVMNTLGVDDDELGLLEAAGVKIIRASFDWNSIESQPGVYEWEREDSAWNSFVNRCADHNIKIWAIPYPGNDLYDSNGFTTADAGYYGTSSFRQGYDAFVSKTVAHYSSEQYNGKFVAWELWNEPNYGDSFWAGNSPVDYMNLAKGVQSDGTFNGVDCTKGALQLIREAAGTTNVAIVAPGLADVKNTVDPTYATDTMTYLNDCVNYNPPTGGLLSSVDAVTVHSYRNSNPETIATGGDSSVYNYSDFRGVTGNTPLIAGEWGYPLLRTDNGSPFMITDANGTNPMTLQTQADFLQRGMLVNFSEHIPMSMWFNDIDVPDFNYFMYGLFDENHKPKPAYYAMKAMTSNLTDCTYWDKFTADDSPEWLLRFSNQSTGREQYVLWTTGTPGPYTMIFGLGTTYVNGTPLYVGEVQQWQSTGTTNWSTATWSNTTGGGNGAWVQGSQANFSTAGATISVDTAAIISGLQFAANGNVTLSNGGGELNFGLGGGILHTAGLYTDTVNANITGGGDPAACQFRKTGAGTLTLGGNNTVVGNLIIAEGVVKANSQNALQNLVVTLNSNGCLTFGDDAGGGDYLDLFSVGGLAGTGSLPLTNVGTLTLGGSNALSFYSGILGGSGSSANLVKTGTSDQVLSGNNTYTGSTTINQGSIVMDHVNALGNNPYSQINLNGGALSLNGHDLAATHPLTIGANGGGLANWNTGTTSTVSSSSVTLNSDFYVCGTGNITLSSAFGSTANRTLIADCALLTLSGSTDNAYLALLATSGTVQLDKASGPGVHAVGGTGITGLDSGARVVYTGTGDYQLSGCTINMTGGTIDFNGRYQRGTSMNITDAGSTIANTNSDWSGYYGSSITASTGFNVDSASVLDLSTTIVGSDVLLQKFGSGQLWLTGGTANTGLGIVAYAGDICLNKTNTTAVDGLVAAFSGGRVLYTNTDNQVTQNGQFDLWGGTIDFNGHFQSGTSMNVYTPGSTIANTAANTLMCYSPTSIAVNSTHAFTTALNTFTVDVASNSLLDLPTGIVCDTADGTVWPTLAKTGLGTVTLGGGAVANTNLTVDAREGTVVFNKVSSAANYIYSALAVAVQAGATVQYAGSGDGQVAQTGGWIHLNGGTLDFNGMNQIGTALTVIAGSSGSTLANTAAGTTSTYSPSSATLDANLTVNAVGNLSVQTAMTGSGKLTKDGTGTLTLSRANTYSGGTTIKAGTLLADFTASGAPTTNILPNTGVLTLSGGTLQTKFSSASSAQTVASTTVSSGGSVVKADNAAATLSLNGITRNTAGGTVNFSTPANIAHISTSTLNCNPTGSKQSILGGYATFGGNTWAVSNNTAGTWNIYGLADGSYFSGFGTGATNQDVDAPVNTSTINPSGSGLTINSLRFNKSTNPSTVSISSSKTLTVATGGILETSTVNTRAVTISGSGSLTTGNGKDLIVHQNNPNASMTISANISGSGLGLTKSGVGNLILSGTKNYNGVTTVNGGTLTLNSTGNINAVNGVVMLNTGGTLLQNSGTALTRSITFNGGTLGGSGQYTGNINMGSSSGHLSPGAAGVGSIGTLTIGGTGNVTLGSASVLDFDLTNTTAGNYDVLALSGTSRNLTLDGTINITSSTGVTAGNYPIITGITGTFVDNILNFGTVPSGHSSWSYYKDGTTLYVHAAPEPGTVVLLATGLLGLLAYAWRKRR